MARKITMNASSNKTVAEVFEDFVISQTAQGLSETMPKHHPSAVWIRKIFEMFPPFETKPSFGGCLG